VPRPLTLDTHEAAIQIARIHGFHFYDSPLSAATLAVALERVAALDLESNDIMQKSASQKGRCIIPPALRTSCEF
jgi:hypothetical protein